MCQPLPRPPRPLGPPAAPVVEEVKAEMAKEKGNPFTMKTMAKIKNKIEGW